MTLRVVESEQGRESLIRLIEGHKLPITVNITKGVNRSLAQNRLQHMWHNEASDQLQEYSPSQYKGICKLTLGVPILRAEDEEFRHVYDKLIMPMEYEDKCEIMSMAGAFDVSKKMTTKQHKDYLDAIYVYYTGLGVSLTDPETLGLTA